MKNDPGPLFRDSTPPMPEQGKPCTVEQLAAWICHKAKPGNPGGPCVHAARCARQVIGDSWCFLAISTPGMKNVHRSEVKA